MSYISRAEKVQGWMTRRELWWLYSQAARVKNVIEIGSWKGRSTIVLSACKGTLHAVDHWKGEFGNPAYIADFQRKTSREIQLEFVQNLFSELAARKVMMWDGDRLETLTILYRMGIRADMVFIDADHKYYAVKQDIEMSLRFLKSGGLLCGHDYSKTDPGVVQAVDELFPHRQVYETIWSVYPYGKQNSK